VNCGFSRLPEAVGRPTDGGAGSAASSPCSVHLKFKINDFRVKFRNHFLEISLELGWEGDGGGGGVPMGPQR
jgi:hypothetical protein